MGPEETWLWTMAPKTTRDPELSQCYRLEVWVWCMKRKPLEWSQPDALSLAKSFQFSLKGLYVVKWMGPSMEFSDGIQTSMPGCACLSEGSIGVRLFSGVILHWNGCVLWLDWRHLHAMHDRHVVQMSIRGFFSLLGLRGDVSGGGTGITPLLLCPCFWYDIHYLNMPGWPDLLFGWIVIWNAVNGKHLHWQSIFLHLHQRNEIVLRLNHRCCHI